MTRVNYNNLNNMVNVLVDRFDFTLLNTCIPNDFSTVFKDQIVRGGRVVGLKSGRVIQLRNENQTLVSDRVYGISFRMLFVIIFFEAKFIFHLHKCLSYIYILFHTYPTVIHERVCYTCMYVHVYMHIHVYML